MILPKNWIEIPLRKIVSEMQSGFAQAPHDQKIGSVPQIRTNNIDKDGELNLNEIKYISSKEQDITRYQLISGDIIFNNTNSDDWVGKTALFNINSNYVFSNHITRIRADQRVVSSRFLAKYLHLLWSIGYSKSKSKQWVNQATVDAKTLNLYKIPIPTLLEQNYILEILQEIEQIKNTQSVRKSLIQDMLNVYFFKIFGNIFQNENNWKQVRLKDISTIVRGSSPRPQGDPRYFGGSVARLMVSDLTRDGFRVNAVTDSLTEEGARQSRFMKANSVVMAVSGAPGSAAILNHDACIHDGFVGFRDLKSDIYPEYFVFALNFFKGLNNQRAPGAVFKNLTTDQVKSLKIPIPPIKLQKKFIEFINQTQKIETLIHESSQILKKLHAEIQYQGFSGELTEKWRENLTTELDVAAQARDMALRVRANHSDAVTISVGLIGGSLDFYRPAREWLYSQLSDFQKEVWHKLRTWQFEEKTHIVPDDSEQFETFRETLDTHASAEQTKRALEQLAGLGLIAKVLLPIPNEDALKIEPVGYVTAFRNLRDDEQHRLQDITALDNSLNNSRER